MSETISEQMAHNILRAAMLEGRCAEFIECLFGGGSATVDSTDGRLVLISGDLLSDLIPDPSDEIDNERLRHAVLSVLCPPPGYPLLIHHNESFPDREEFIAIADSIAEEYAKWGF